MLRVAPTNQKLREELFKYFLQSGHPETALRGGRRGPQARSVQRRPVRPQEQRLPLPERLQVRGRRAGDAVRHRQHQGRHAVLHQDLAPPPPRARSPTRCGCSSGRRSGVRKYPDNPTLLGYLNKAYTLTGQTDSVVAVTNRIMAKDTTDVVPALSAAKSLIDAKRPKEAVPFLDFAIKHGDPAGQGKRGRAALHRRRPAAAAAAGSARRRRAAPDGGRARPTRPARCTPASNYLLGLATLFQVPQIDPQAEKQKSCDLARQEETLLGEAETALTAGPRGQPGGGRQEPRHHQAVQAARRVDAQGVLQVGGSMGRSGLPIFTPPFQGAVAQLG